MRADRREALLDFLLEAVADGGTTPFPGHVLAGLRRAVGCEAVSYMEWSPLELLEQSLAAEEPDQVLQVWAGYRQVRHEDPLPGGAGCGSPLPDRDWLGQPLMICDFLSDREFRHGGLYAEMCKPFGVRAVMKVFLPTGGATGAALVFETAGSRFTENRPAGSPVPCPAPGAVAPQCARARDLSSADRFHRGGPGRSWGGSRRANRSAVGDQIVGGDPGSRLAPAGFCNTVIAQALFVSPGTIRKHLEHIYGKLEVRGRTEAAAIYAQEQVVKQNTAWTPGRGPSAGDGTGPWLGESEAT